MTTKNYRNKKGFTLIELLIVVLIISILAGLLLTVINPTGIRKKTRDAQRKSDIKRIQTALELHFADKRQYPSTGGTFQVAGVGTNIGQVNYELTSGKYLCVVPRDPLALTDSAYGDAFTGCSDDKSDYSYNSDGCEYYLVATMEMETSADDSKCSDVSNGVFSCGATTYCYAAQNP